MKMRRAAFLFLRETGRASGAIMVTNPGFRTYGWGNLMLASEQTLTQDAKLQADH
jgi:hypothetical protein